MSDAHNSANTANLRCFIASLAALNQVDEAHQIAGRLLKLVPTFRLATFRSRTPLPGEVRDLVAKRLRIAGVPE
jgi:hypothetical protein